MLESLLRFPMYAGAFRAQGPGCAGFTPLVGQVRIQSPASGLHVVALLHGR
jgi:hypothetical protein